MKPCEHAQVRPNWEYDVFLCHEGGSKDFATKIFHALTLRHIRAFLDKECFLGSQTVPPTLAQAIYMSRFVMVILTAEFISKEHPTYEYRLAMERHKTEKYSTGLGVVLPVFHTISPDRVSGYLDIQRIVQMAGYERRDESEDVFLQTKLIPEFTSLIDKVCKDKEGNVCMLLACTHPIVGLLTTCSYRTDKG